MMPAAPSLAACAPETRARISALIAMRHPATRSSLHAVLEDEPEIEVLAASGELRNAVSLLRSLEPDVVLLDSGALGEEGLRRLPLLRAARPATAFIVLGMGDHPEYAAHARRAGAVDYVCMSEVLERLPEVVRAAGRVAGTCDAAVA